MMTYEIDKFIGKPVFILCDILADELDDYDGHYVQFLCEVDEHTVKCVHVPAYYVIDYQYSEYDYRPSNYLDYGTYPKAYFEVRSPLEIFSVDELHELLEQADAEYTLYAEDEED